MSMLQERPGNNEDFWRDIPGDKPDSIDDWTECITHDGSIHIGKTLGSDHRAWHMGVAQFEGNGNFRYQTIYTNIPMNSTIMPTFEFTGYGYGDAETIKFQAGCYTYNVPANNIINTVASSSGSIKPETVTFGNDGGNLVIELDWGVNKHFYRWGLNVFNSGNNSGASDKWFCEWKVDGAQFPASVTNTVKAPWKKECCMEAEQITRSGLIGLRNANNLDLCKTYEITDPAQPTNLAGSTLFVKPLSENRLPTTYFLFNNAATSTDLWQVEYDIDSNQYDEVRDSKYLNVVRGHNTIMSFPWNNSNIQRNTLDNNATFNYTGGSFTGNMLRESSVVTLSGGSFQRNVVEGDAEVTIQTGANIDNVFGGSTVFNQVGTGRIQYSRINGTTGWTNGNTNVSNVIANTAKVNTTGSSGTISNSTFDRAYCANMQNVASLTISDSTISNYGQVSINGAARLYFYRSTNTDGSRILISAGSRIDASYTNVDSYSFLQSTGNGGFLRANYCNTSSHGYIRNTTTNTNYAERCHVSSQSSIRFDGSANNCRIYYSTSHGGGAIYMTGSSNNSYVYYSSVDSGGQIYCNNSTNARMYYNHADSRSYIISQGNSTTHYMYYCNAKASGYLYTLNNGNVVRMYACSASDVAQMRLQSSTANTNLYYSKVDSYYYLYVNGTGGTKSGLFGQGRRSLTTNTATAVAPYNTGSAWQNVS